MLPLCHNYFQVSPSNKNNKDGIQQFQKRKYAFGVFILLLVVVLWVLSSEVTKYLYTEKHLERPFLVTYVRSSLLFIYLLVLCFTPPTKDPCRPADYTQLLEQAAETDDENFYNESSTNSLHKIHNSLMHEVNALNHSIYISSSDARGMRPLPNSDEDFYAHYHFGRPGDSTFVPVRAGETTDSDDAAPRAVRFNKVAEVRVMSAAMAGEALLARLSWAASVRASEHAQRRAAAAATRRHLRLAMFFFIPWFISNYLYRLSLLHTTTSSATMYTSTAGAFALSLGALFAQVPTDRFNASKYIGVLLTAGGLVVLGILESHQSNWVAVLSALGAALCYSLHLMLFRQELRKGDGINSPLLVGLVGCACGCISWAIGGVLGAAGVERADLPEPRLWTFLLLDAALGPLLLDSLWLWGRSLTSSATASCMLGLAAPLAAIVEVLRGAGTGGVWRGAAALLTALGWTAALLDLPHNLSFNFITNRIRAAEGFTVIRNIPDLDEQSEALMSSDEPT